MRGGILCFEYSCAPSSTRIPASAYVLRPVARPAAGACIVRMQHTPLQPVLHIPPPVAEGVQVSLPYPGPHSTVGPRLPMHVHLQSLPVSPAAFRA